MQRFLVSLCYCSILGLSLAVLWLSAYTSPQVTQAKRLIAKTQAEATARLSHVRYELETSPVIMSKIRSSSAYGLHSELQKLALVSDVDELAVYDHSCQLVGTSAKGLPLVSLCQRGHKAFEIEPIEQGLQVHHHQTSMIHGKPLKLIVRKQFDQTWLTKSIPPQLSFLELRITNQASRATLMTLSEAAFITSEAWWQPVFWSQQNSSYYYLLAMLSCLGLAHIFYRRLEQEKHEHQTLRRSCNDLLESLTVTPRTQVDAMSQQLLELKDRLYQDDFKNRKHMELSQSRVNFLESEVIALKQQLSLLKSQQSLQEQMKAGADRFLELQQGVASQMEDLKDTIHQGLVPPCQRVYQVSRRWQSELQCTSPRKFIRSLSERPISQSWSQLDEDLSQLLQGSQFLGNLSLQIALQGQKILNQLHQTESVARHWLNLSSSEYHGAQTLDQVLYDAQAMVPLATDIPDISFENHIREAVDLQGLGVPAPTWSSLIYHLILACVESCRHIQGAVVVHLRHFTKGEKQILVISTNTLDQKITGLEPSAKKHLRLAQELGARYKLDVLSLPFTEGEIPLAICWEIQNVQKFSTSSKIASKSRLSSLSPESSV